MAKLNQIVAVVKDRKEEAKRILTEAYHLLQKPDLFSGMTRTYRPRLEDELPLQQEYKQLQATTDIVIRKTREAFTAAADTVLTQDAANATASADVVAELNGAKLELKNVPVTHLLFLEKQLVDLRTLIEKAPTLDPSERWEKDSASGLYKTPPQESVRTRKVQKPIVLYPATEQHPAQTQVVTEDVAAGVWETVKFSGAISVDHRRLLLRRVTVLQEAVKVAREAANSIDVIDRKEGDQIFDFIFGS